MSHFSTRPHRRSIFRRYWKPVAITGASGTAVAVWLDEIVLFGEEILVLVFLPLLAGVIYLFDTILFKSRIPRREDMENLADKRSNGK